MKNILLCILLIIVAVIYWIPDLLIRIISKLLEFFTDLTFGFSAHIATKDNVLLTLLVPLFFTSLLIYIFRDSFKSGEKKEKISLILYGLISFHLIGLIVKCFI